MKELTIEEKAQRYDEAIKKLHEIITMDNRPVNPKEIGEYVFPELKDGDDERIRKHLIGVVELYYGNTDEQEKKDCLAWLEKQCGQKSAELPKGEDYGIDGLYAAIDILQKVLGEVDGYQSDDGILEHKCAITAVKKLYEKKPTKWSEEDEGFYIEAVKLLTNQSLYETCINLRTEVVDWLKSLKDRYTWKPSGEQMKYLHKYAEQNNYDGAILTGLYNDLKQLKQL